MKLPFNAATRSQFQHLIESSLRYCGEHPNGTAAVATLTLLLVGLARGARHERERRRPKDPGFFSVPEKPLPKEELDRQTNESKTGLSR